MTEPKNVKALETGSGIAWKQWVDFLEPLKALDHTDMAKLVYEEIMRAGKAKSPEWWAQGVTVAYEQYMGRRQPGQTCDGNFSVTVTKTVEGDMGILGFSPRKAALTIYFYEGFGRYGAELAKLGKHKHSASCLYVNKLEDIDLTVLTAMIQSSYAIATERKPKTVSVDEYIASIPAAARPRFDELRMLVKAALAHAREVVSYGIIGYKIDDKRPRVFISGWKDHLGVYPIPSDDALRIELEPYIKGKGTLWFKLDTPLPKQLLRRTVRALTAS